VVRKALVELEGAPFQALAAHRGRWALEDAFRSPGPIQFSGDTPDSPLCEHMRRGAITDCDLPPECPSGPGADAANFTLALEINDGAPIHI
jgi:hypothetical protein